MKQVVVAAAVRVAAVTTANGKFQLCIFFYFEFDRRNIPKQSAFCFHSRKHLNFGACSVLWLLVVRLRLPATLFCFGVIFRTNARGVNECVCGFVMHSKIWQRKIVRRQCLWVGNIRQSNVQHTITTTNSHQFSKECSKVTRQSKEQRTTTTKSSERASDRTNNSKLQKIK